MSVEFSLRNCNLANHTWPALINGWGKNSGYEFFIDSSCSKSEQGLGAHLFGPDSTRGVAVAVSEQDGQEQLEVRLLAFSSRHDWEMAFALLAHCMAEVGGELFRDGELWTDPDLDVVHAHRHALEDLSFSMQASLQQDGEISLTLMRYAIPIARSMFEGVEQDVEQFEQRLAEWVEPFVTAYESPSMRLKGDIRFGAWALIPTMLSQCEFIGIDYDGNIVVPVSAVLEVLGSRAQICYLSYATDVRPENNALYLPELDIDDPADKLLLDALSARAISMDDEMEKRGVDLGDEEEAEDAPEIEDEIIRTMASAVLHAIFTGASPVKIHAELQRKGMPKTVADDIVHGVGNVLTAVLAQGQSFEEAKQNCKPGSGSQAMSQPLIEGVEKALSERGESLEKARESYGHLFAKKKGCAASILLMLGTAAAIASSLA